MDKFLKRHKLLKLIQEEIDNLNDPMLIKLEFNLQLKVLPSEWGKQNKQKTTPGSDGFISEF